MEGATDLSDLLSNSPVQQPAFAPMVTAGDPFISPLPPATSTKVAPDYSQQFSILICYLRNLVSYLSFFLSATIMSLSKPRELILPYIPIQGIYGEGGILSWTGSAVIGALTTILSFVLNTVFNTLL